MKRKFKLLALWAALAAFGLLTAADVWAANGQVAGTVLDKKTKEPLTGARVRLLLPDGNSAKIGAITDEKGNFLILNVPPGTYDVEISFGTTYAKNLIKGIRVETDGKETLETVRLAEQAIEGDTVIVSVKKAEIRKEVMNTQVKVSAEEIQRLPIRNVQDLISLQVGVVKSADGQIHIRGGRNDETIYIIDGVEVRDIVGGTTRRGQVQSGSMSVAPTAIQEFTLLKGGFDAQFGNATSGVINISTKEGNTDRTRFHVEYFTDRFGSPTLNKYSFNSDQIQFSLAGPEPFLGWIFPRLLKWNTEGKVAYFASLQMDKTDTHLSYNKFASPLTQKTFPVTNILGVALPDREQNQYNTQIKFTIRPSGLLKMNVDWKNEFLIYNYVGTQLQWNNRYSPATAQVVNDRSSTFSISAEHSISRKSFYRAQISNFYKRFIERPGDPFNPRHGKNPDLFIFDDETERFTDLDNDGVWDAGEPFTDVYREDTTADGRPIYTPPNPATGFGGDPFEDLNGNGIFDGAEPLPAGGDKNGNGRFDANRRDIYTVDNPEPFRDGDLVLGEPFIDMNKNGVFDPAVDRFITCNCPENQDYNFNSAWDGPGSPYSAGLPFKDFNGNGFFDAPNSGVREPGEPFIDVNGNGRYDFGGNGYVDPGTYTTINYQNRLTTQTTAKFDFNSQIKDHFFSAGLQMDMTKLGMQEIQAAQFRYNGVPDGGAFADRGLLRDFWIWRPIIGDFYLSDRLEYGQLLANVQLRYDFFLQSSGLNALRVLETLGSKTQDPLKNRLSPRLGFSYPISERAKLFFNYGHYYQLPNLEQFYRRSTQIVSGRVGNFNLDYAKKVKYEFGSEVLLSSNYRAVLTGFYNDDFGLVNTQRFTFGTIARDEPTNTDYGRTRGFEATVSKVGGGYFQANLDYSFSIAMGKSSSEISNLGRAPDQISLLEFPLNWDQRHQVTLNVNLNVPNGDHPPLFGLKLPDNWNLNLIWQYGSGQPYTPGTAFPGLPSTRTSVARTNSLRKTPTSQVDLRFQKSFKVWRQDYTFQLWVNNLLDRRNQISFADGNTSSSNTGRPNTESVVNVNGDFIALPGSPFQQDDPRVYNTGRNIKMGLAVDF